MYIDNREQLLEFLNENFKYYSKSKIKVAQCIGGLYFDDEDKYFTDSFLYLEFENGYRFSLSTTIYSLGEFCVTKEKIEKDSYPWELRELLDTEIVGFDVNKFTHEFVVSYATDETRPEGGDYFSDIYLLLSNNRKIHIVAADAEFDGYMYVNVEEQTKDDDLLLMCRLKSGNRMCVPLSKLDKITSKTQQEFDDVANDKSYNGDWDKVVFAFIENGHGSHALAQKITGKKYSYCGRLMDYLSIYGYIDVAENNWKCKITKEEFEEIISRRNNQKKEGILG